MGRSSSFVSDLRGQRGEPPDAGRQSPRHHVRSGPGREGCHRGQASCRVGMPTPAVGERDVARPPSRSRIASLDSVEEGSECEGRHEFEGARARGAPGRTRHSGQRGTAARAAKIPSSSARPARGGQCTPASARRLRPRENSEVSPRTRSVAVALVYQPVGAIPSGRATKVARPLASVVTRIEPRKRSPSP